MQIIAFGDVIFFQNHRAIIDRPYGCGEKRKKDRPGGRSLRVRRETAEIATALCASQ